MKKQKHFPAETKVKILREMLRNQRKVSELAEAYDVSPQTLYKWEKQLFEGALDIFTHSRGSRKMQHKVSDLEKTLKVRNEVISEIMQENIQLKKKLPGKN
jgi:transposase-like protein